ncbi:rho guanine nucleotide exchange factor 17-like [Brachionus plicatilis]|uniref:Rho guanine nucleotide exchange factor 17-like n=1 Tax=Brachionus plicatilis TaxID=10195 RepID=A0A3M7SXL5_BRAPC|nr:rho guanine nucleotide exchange factor 17-like [Brachionus plicatilis]
MDECLRDLSVGIKRQLTDTSAATNSLNSSSSSGVHNSSNSFYTSQQINSNENTNANESKQNQLVLTINTMERMEIMTLIFNTQELKWNWEKCFIENKKIFYESFSRKPASFLSAIAIPRNRSGVNFTCASPRFCNEQYDVWICNTDGKMSQICILNTNPELAVTSCNTISNSKISCIQCVPPYQIKRLGSSKSRKYLMRSHKNESTDTTDSRFDSATIVSSHSINSGFLFKEESLIDYDSSDDEEKDSGNEGKENQINQNPSQNIPNHGSLSIQDLKNCTMWIGNEDGSLNIFQFNDSTIRTVARKNRITKQFSAGINSIAYIDNKVIVSLKNGELIVFKRLFSIWNFDNHIIKALSDTPFSQMITVAGKLWCASSNIIKILNPETLDCENQITIENEKSIYLAAGGNCTWAVWVACLTTLDLKLYHVTKFTVLADINIKQCVVQKLAGIDEIIRIHKIHTLKITCCYICKDTLWIGTTAGVIVNIKIPHINNSTIKLNTILNINGLNQGHIGPVRFISSTEVSKQQQINKPNSEQFENSSLDKSNSAYKTVVITGGEGFEEYKAVSTLGSGISLSNSNASNLGTNFISENPNNMTTSGNSILSSVSGNTSSYHQISNSSISDEFNIGKEDLVNYVLTWET